MAEWKVQRPSELERFRGCPEFRVQLTGDTWCQVQEAMADATRHMTAAKAGSPLFDPRDPVPAAEAMGGLAYLLDTLLHGGQPRAGTGIPPDLCFMLMVTVPGLQEGEENRVAYTGNVEGNDALKLLREMVQLFESGLGGQHLPGRAQAQ